MSYSLREQGLRQYLDEGAAALPQSTAHSCWFLWSRLSANFKAMGQILEVPDCCFGESLETELIWRDSRYYLEVDILQDGTVEFFSRDLLTQELWGLDTHLLAPFQSELLTRLSRFIIP